MSIYSWWSRLNFKDSTKYWRNNYDKGGNSGDGSYKKFAVHKADTVNNFVQNYKINSIVEYGCGDGNQLAHYDFHRINYIGYDVSQKAIDLCTEKFSAYKNMKFSLIDPKEIHISKLPQFDLSMSIDVLYHLIEDPVFFKHLDMLFFSSKKYVIIFSTNTNVNINEPAHVKHREFVPIILERFPEWKLYKVIKNTMKNKRFKIFADFYIFKKIKRED